MSNIDLPRKDNFADAYGYPQYGHSKVSQYYQYYEPQEPNHLHSSQSQQNTNPSQLNEDHGHYEQNENDSEQTQKSNAAEHSVDQQVVMKTESALNNAEKNEALNQPNYSWQPFPNYHQNESNLANFKKNPSTFHSSQSNFYQNPSSSLPYQNNFHPAPSNNFLSSSGDHHRNPINIVPNQGNVDPNPSISTPNQGSFQTNQGSTQERLNGSQINQWQFQPHPGLFQQHQGFIQQNLYNIAPMWNNHILYSKQQHTDFGLTDPYGWSQQGSFVKTELDNSTSNDETSDLGSSFNTTGGSEDSFSPSANSHKVGSATKFKAAVDDYEWVPDSKTLPEGWKKRTSQHRGGRAKLAFLSPTNEKFLTRISVEAYMTKHSHIYTQDDIKRFRLNYNLKIREYTNWDDRDPTLPFGWFKRECDYRSPDGIAHKEYQYLSSDKQTFNSRNAVVKHMQKSNSYSEDDIQKVLSGKGNGRPKTYQKWKA